ncbi:MAG: 16S rRNA (cytosine(1402)-N(4))-methyltransferase RsmH [Dehalococcoidales bacterium]|jgi:16S rRNA (cytosine1402-N4)-methyltransferase|nr:16S rRNA (cytosine(1402)-N(4))-methyltransferase RsmH [Dehalococcoidales bacterium]
MNNSASGLHVPVMLQEAIHGLKVETGGRYVDCTVGAAGHSTAILNASSPGGQLLGFEADPQAVAIARERLEAFGSSALIVNRNFAGLEEECLERGFFPLNGVLFDLGLSSMQLAESGRGFSFQYDAPLDMRFSPDQELSVEEIVNSYKESDIASIIYRYGEEPASRRIAAAIVNNRPLHTTVQLADIIARAVGGKKGRIHPATRTFQAFRIAVNRELENLESALYQALNLLGCGGRLVVISYHSLEDRIVKRFFREESRNCICLPGSPVCTCSHRASIKQVNRKVITPSPEEIRQNPRSRSARMRIAERVIARQESSLNSAGLFFVSLTGCLAGVAGCMSLN